jgi:hypothetical protein
MTWTYDATLSTTRDKVRALLGDVDTTDQQVTDEVIALLLSEQGDNMYRAAAAAARACAAKYAREASIGIGSLRIQSDTLSQKYLNLASAIDAMGDNAPGGLGSPIHTGGSVGDMEDAEEDTDRPAPSFKVGMTDDPAVRPPGNAGALRPETEL